MIFESQIVALAVRRNNEDQFFWDLLVEWCLQKAVSSLQESLVMKLKGKVKNEEYLANKIYYRRRDNMGAKKPIELILNLQEIQDFIWDKYNIF